MREHNERSPPSELESPFISNHGKLPLECGVPTLSCSVISVYRHPEDVYCTVLVSYAFYVPIVWNIHIAALNAGGFTSAMAHPTPHDP